MNETMNKVLVIVSYCLLLMIIGYEMAKQEQTMDLLKEMRVQVAVCGDVAAYFAPNDELTAGAELSQAPRRKP